MTKLKKYRKSHAITAVQLNLETEGFTYHKWGHEQVCKRGDWLVDIEGAVYTVSDGTFAASYAPVSPGRYVKTAPVWAEVALTAGKFETREGYMEYEQGDYIVFNSEDRVDAYTVSKAKFEAMYELAEDE